MFDYMIQRNAEQRRKEIKKRTCPPVNFHQFNYGIMTGNWYLDDSLGDSNGYGHASGNQDGSGGAGDDEDDCELWFDITQNDADADGLTWWQEVRERAPGEDAYGTDPTDPDTDGDGLRDGWEVNAFKNPLNSEDTYQIELNIYFRDFTPSNEYMLDLEYAMGLLSKRVYDATDGYSFIRCVNFYIGGPSILGKPLLDNQIHVATSYVTQVYWVSVDSSLNQKWMTMISNPIDLEEGPQSWALPKWNELIMHEFGHLLFVIPDEYYDPGSCTCIMDFLNPDCTEFCNDYSCTKPDYLQSGGSCWERLFNNMNSYNGLYQQLIDFDLNHDGITDTTYYHEYHGFDGPYDSVDNLLSFTVNW